MPSLLPLNVLDLVNGRGVESARVELKATWNEGPTQEQVLHTICAFANDLYELNGGYIVIGVAEDEGRAVLPPAGVAPSTLDEIQKRIRVLCKTKIQPEYYPVMSPELIDGRHVLVLWAPASDARPHRAPRTLKDTEFREWVRIGAETIDASRDPALRQQLLERTAKVPFDDRRNTSFGLHDLRATLVREHLSDVRSGLLEEQNDEEIYRRLRLSARVNGHEVPRNVALLFFSDDPEKAFPGARVEVVQFSAGGDTLEERVFRGPLVRQVRDCLTYLQNVSSTLVRKVPNQPQATTATSYPFPAIEEAVVNAVYHRSYEGTPEPTKIYLYPDRIEVTSYPGPVAGLAPDNFAPGARLPNVPARNRRIGELLKEVRLAEARGTGVRKIQSSMERNDSPPPSFHFDSTRTYFTVVLPAHPEYAALNAIREASYLLATGDNSGARERLSSALKSGAAVAPLVLEMVRIYVVLRDFDHALATAEKHSAALPRTAQLALAQLLRTLPWESLAPPQQERLARLLVGAINDDTLALIPAHDAIDRGDWVQAHQAFTAAGPDALATAWPLHRFAKSKVGIAQDPATDPAARARLVREATLLLERARHLTDDEGTLGEIEKLEKAIEQMRLQDGATPR